MGFMVTEVSVHKWLTRLYWAQGEAPYHGGRTQKREAARPPMTGQKAEKERERGGGEDSRADAPFQGMHPVTHFLQLYPICLQLLP